MAEAAPTGVRTRHPAAFLIFLYLAFALTGILTALPGPLLPILTGQWKLTDAQAGSIIAAQFLGNLGGCLFANRNLRLSLLLGMALIALGTGTFVLAGWPAVKLCFLCYGAGLGLSIPAINLTVAALLPDRRAVTLNLLNSVWGLGAISSSGLLLLAQHVASAKQLLLCLAFGGAALFAAFLGSPKADTASSASLEDTSTATARVLAFFGLAFFLYVGVETCIASWIGAYALRMFPSLRLIGFSLLTSFWTALALGRAASAYLLKFVPARAVYFFSLALALAAFAGILWGRSPGALAAGTIVCGLALAPVFPLLLSFAARPLLSHPNSGWVFACAPLGGALLPWSIGKISTAYSALHAGMLVPAAAMACLFLMGFWNSAARD